MKKQRGSLTLYLILGLVVLSGGLGFWGYASHKGKQILELTNKNKQLTESNTRLNSANQGLKNDLETASKLHKAYQDLMAERDLKYKQLDDKYKDVQKKLPKPGGRSEEPPQTPTQESNSAKRIDALWEAFCNRQGVECKEKK